jgi:hypothetical protein
MISEHDYLGAISFRPSKWCDLWLRLKARENKGYVLGKLSSSLILNLANHLIMD